MQQLSSGTKQPGKYAIISCTQIKSIECCGIHCKRLPARFEQLFHLKAFIWQKFAGQRDVDAIAGRIGLTIDFEIEVDGAHNAVAELILDDFFHSRSKNTDHLSYENGRYQL